MQTPPQEKKRQTEVHLAALPKIDKTGYHCELTDVHASQVGEHRLPDIILYR